jgi:hypothetical protein
MDFLTSSTLLGANLCAWRHLKVQGKWYRNVRRVAETEAYTVNTKNIISLPSGSTLCLAVTGNIFDLSNSVFHLPSS